MHASPIERRTGSNLHSAKSFNATPLFSSSCLGWRGLLVQRFHSKTVDVETRQLPNLMLHVHRGNPIVMEVRERGRVLMQPLAADDITITPPGWSGDLVTRQPASVTAFCFSSFKPDFVEQLVDEHVRSRHLEVLAKRGIRDYAILQLCCLLEDEVAAGGINGRLYSEGLCAAMVARLVRCHSADRFSPPQSKGGLAGYALRRVCEYIEAHLGHDISLDQLAKLAGKSSYHFARLFRQSTGYSAHQYLIHLRMRRATDLLREPSRSISEIAGEVGYGSQSHFTAVFRQKTGLTPKKFRSQCGQ